MKRFLYAIALVLLASACGTKQEKSSYSWEEDLQHRIKRDFRLTEAQVKKYIQKYWQIFGIIQDFKRGGR